MVEALGPREPVKGEKGEDLLDRWVNSHTPITLMLSGKLILDAVDLRKELDAFGHQLNQKDPSLIALFRHLRKRILGDHEPT